MSLLLRGKEVLKRPVVTLAGEDVAQVKDVVYAGGGGEVAGFTLAGRGLFAGPLPVVLPWAGVRGLGRDAVVVDSEDAFCAPGELRGGGGDVLGSRVLTDDGTELGKVVDVVIEVGEKADVVGYELKAGQGLDTGERRVLIPLPDTLAVSSEALVVPASATEFVADDLAGFGAAVDAFRARLRGDGR